MPFIDFAGHVVECPRGANLRVVLLRARLPLYSGAARALNCRGSALCGTCAVGIVGEASAPTEAELRRLSLFPHRPEAELRLACQCNVLGDLKVTRYAGLFGHRTDTPGK
jgi:ferredoxin